jgi:hypothetical protein
MPEGFSDDEYSSRYEDFATVLTSADGKNLTKQHTPGGTVDYDRGFLFRAKTVPISGLEDMARVFDTLQPNQCVVLDRPAEGLDIGRPHRRLSVPDDNPETRQIDRANYQPAAHQWLPIDFDSPEDAPGWIDALQSGRLPDAVWLDLPHDLIGCRFYWKLSSGAGIKPGIRVRLIFWLSQAMTRDEVKRWLAPYKAAIDGSLYDPVHVIYGADPIFNGVPNPVSGHRSGIIDGAIAAAPEVPADVVDPKQEREQPAEKGGVAEIVLRETLSYIDPPDEEPEWRKLVAAIKATPLIGGGIEPTAQRGEQVAVDWSAGRLDRAGKYRDSFPDNWSGEKIIREKYRAAKAERDGKLAGFGTLIHEARRGGMPENRYHGQEVFRRHRRISPDRNSRHRRGAEDPGAGADHPRAAVPA